MARESKIYNAFLNVLLAGDYTDPAELRVLRRIASRRPHILTYLDHPDVDPTNNLAERQLRHVVVFRKLAAGNKSQRGARTLEIIKSLTVTCQQQGRDFAELLRRAMSLGLPPPPPMLLQCDEP